jgi:hypothetical protein
LREAALEPVERRFKESFLDRLPHGILKRLTAEQQDELVTVAWACVQDLIQDIPQGRLDP